MHSKLPVTNNATARALSKIEPASASRDYDAFFSSFSVPDRDGEKRLIPFDIHGDEKWYALTSTSAREAVFRIRTKFLNSDTRVGIVAQSSNDPHDEVSFISQTFIDALDDPIELLTSYGATLKHGEVAGLLKAMGITVGDLDQTNPREKFFSFCIKRDNIENEPFLIEIMRDLYGKPTTLQLTPHSAEYSGVNLWGVSCGGWLDLAGGYMPVFTTIKNTDCDVIKLSDVDEQPLIDLNGANCKVMEVHGNAVVGQDNPLKPGKQRAQEPTSMFAMLMGGGSKNENVTAYITSPEHQRIVLDGDYFLRNKTGMIENLIDKSSKALGDAFITLPKEVTYDSTVVNRRTLIPLTVGFGISNKRLMIMHRDDIIEPTWHGDSFDHLVMEPARKEAIWALLNTPSTDIDFIKSKGSNTSFLLLGPPGTGKTFTAEAIAEKMQKPLLKLSIHDISVNMEAIEENLMMYTRIASRWMIPLLIDEADVLIEERDMTNLARNGIVSTVLQVLEYHTSTLFLTSNRVNTIDPAVRSRITLNIKYAKPDPKPIWKALLGKAGMAESEIARLDDPDLVKQLGTDINGREVKNVISVANRVCRFNDRPFTIDEVMKTANFMLAIG